jgi:hypothetical protein
MWNSWLLLEVWWGVGPLFCALRWAFEAPIVVGGSDGEALLVVLLMQIHVVRRLFECLFVHRFSGSRQSIVVALGGTLSIPAPRIF